MRFVVDMRKKEYLQHMKDNMGGHMELGGERFTGFFLGPLFYVTYHSGYEWNRRFTNQKNAAVGIVKDSENCCVVEFARFRGMMCPLIFLPFLIFVELFFFLEMLPSGNFQPFMLLVGLGVSTIACLLSSLFESWTERSEEGRRALLSFLLNPKDPYGLYSKIP